MLAGKQKFFIVILKLSCFFFTSSLFCQFAPGPNQTGTTAIFKNDSIISFWADSIFLERSWQDISDTTLGKATIGLKQDALGKADATFVSLGDGGEAILSFPFPIYNEPGFDFAVFENGFAQNGDPENFYFMELALVEVSENGTDFIPFECTSNIDTNTQVGSFSTSNCTEVNNLAGKYPLNYGTPFDIEELGLDSILSIKIIDAIGSINSSFAKYDSQGNKINDPFPTPFPSSGFDLNAVAALNQKNIIIDTTLSVISYKPKLDINFFPNQLMNEDNIYFESKSKETKKLFIYNSLGALKYSEEFKQTTRFKIENFSKGIYYVYISNINSFFSSKFIVK